MMMLITVMMMIITISLMYLFPDDPWLVPLSFRVEDNLEQACRCYKKVLDEAGKAPEPDDPQHLVTMVKRYGNILNELGVFYMNQSTSTMTEPTGK